MSNRSRFLVKLTVTLVLLGIVFLRLDLSGFVEVASSANLILLTAAAGVQIGSLFLATQRWRVILNSFDIRLPYAPVARMTFMGFFFSLFLPSGIGGDFFRAYFLSKQANRGMSTTITTTVLERSAGLCALLIIGLIASALYPLEVEGVPLLLVFIAVAGIYLLANVALFHSWTHRKLTSFLKRWKKEDLEEKMELVTRGLRSLRRNPMAVALAILFSLAVQLLAVAVVWVTAAGIGLDSPLRVFLVFVPLINLTIMAPVTINGIGLRESLYALLFLQIGVGEEFSVTLSVLQFAVYLMAGLPGGILYSLSKKETPPPLAKAGASGPARN